uniref:Complex 1 LYR protein domain-containing protein n=1 Tax=Oryza punctata TaxID=4537 RepID=A0A0E0L1K5_ORYPU
MAAAEGLAAYRALLRAARRTFAGDRLMLTESAVEIRRRFEEHRSLAPGSDEATSALSDAREAAHFITHMIVQAQRAPSGSFVVKPEKEHAGATLEVPSEEILSKLK